MKVGIVGYGNLGKSLERLVLKDTSMQLSGIFSRRNLTIKNFVPLKYLRHYVGKIDLLLIAWGSYNDIVEQAENFVGFDTVDSYDNHTKISAYKSLMGKINCKNLSVLSAGWDPGILSAFRALLDFGTPPITLWGEGISQGHSNAIRTIPGVIDGVQFTIPHKDALSLAKQGFGDGTKLHYRQCYVACVEGDKSDIERRIKSMPHYFDGYDTTVTFCSPQEIRKLKKRTQHQGQIVSTCDSFDGYVSLKMRHNALFTAQVMLRYAKAIPQLKADGYLGAMDVLDIPLRYICQNNVI